MTGVQTCALPICFPVTIGGKWERLAVKVDYDDFEELGLGRFIEEQAIEVEEGK